MDDQDLPVTTGAGPDSNCRDFDVFGGRGCDRGGHQFKHDGESAGRFERLRVGDQSVALLLLLALDMVAAFLADVLRQHAQVPKKGNSSGNDCPYLLDNRLAAFAFNGFGSRVLEATG